MRAALLVLLICAFASPVALGRPGDLDAGFGDGGWVVGPPGGPIGIDDMERLPDGRIVVVGPEVPDRSDSLALSRLAPDGSVDPGFGGGAPVATGVSPTAAAPLVVQPDGRILVAGARRGPSWNEKSFFVTRYLADGTRDPSFGASGEVELAWRRDGSTTDEIPYGTGLKALELQRDGRLVLAGISSRARRRVLTLVRLSPDGRLDPTFHRDGVKLIEESSRLFLEPSDVFVRPDGRVVVAGHRRERFLLRPYYRETDRPALLQFEPDGDVSHRFGRRGITVLRNPDDAGRFVQATLRGDGSALALTDEDEGTRFVIRAVSATGRVARGFGVRGKGWVALTEAERADGWRVEPDEFIRQPDGKVLMLGRKVHCWDRGPCDDVPVLARITGRGRRDREFGRGGIATVIPQRDRTVYGTYNAAGELHAVRLGPDERPLVGGRVYAGRDRHFWHAYLFGRMSDSVAPGIPRAPRRLRVSPAGDTELDTGCTREAGGVCVGHLRLEGVRRVNRRRVRYTAADGSFRAAPGTPATVALRLRPLARRQLRAVGRLRVQASLRVRDANGNTARRRWGVTLH